MASSKLHFLKGEEHWYAARKSFSLKPEGPALLSDYSLGKYFSYHNEPIDPDHVGLESLMEILSRQGEDPQVLMVYGSPLPFCQKGECIQRSGEFLAANPQGERLFKVDIDGWETSVQWWRGERSLRAALHGCLIERGLDYLAGKRCLCMFSQSAWPEGPLKVHVYWFLEDFMSLGDMVEWGRAVNERCGTKVIDTSVYRTVQPDYIAQRECAGFNDPFNGGGLSRFTLIEPAAESADTKLVDAIRREIKAYEDSFGTGRVIEGQVTGEGDGWHMTSRAGESGEVNEWCYRGAAKIVQQEGRTAVLADIRTYAQRMWAVAWDGVDGLGGIIVNSGGTRGGKSDAKTYVVARFEQYLRSACDRRFGDEVDRLKSVVEDAVERGISSIFEQPVLDAAGKLKRSWPGHFQEARAAVRSIKGLQIGAWDERVNGAARKAAASRRLSEREGVDAFDVVEEKGAVGVGRLYEDKVLQEIPYCNAIINTIDWFTSDGVVWFIDLLNKGLTEQGGYRCLEPGEVAGTITVRGAELIHSTGGGVSPEWTAKRVLGTIDQGVKAAGGVAASKRWGTRALARRYHAVGGVLWINLGLEDTDPLTGEGGEYRCMRCDREGKVRMTWLAALAGYPDAPVWAFDRTTIGAGANDSTGFVGYMDDVNGTELGLFHSKDGEWLMELRDLIGLSSDYDLGSVATWLVSVMLDLETKFVLQINGPPAVGKSTAGDILCMLVDPPKGAEGMGKKSSRRFHVGSLADGSMADTYADVSCAVLDNVSSLTSGRQDKMCMISTGMKVQDRVLYTNFTFDRMVHVSFVVACMEDVVTRPDLASRTLNVSLKKRIMYALGPKFAQVRSTIFDGLVALTMKVLHIQGGGGQVSRRHLANQIESIIWGAEGDEVAKGEQSESAFNLVVNDRFASCFMAWLQHDKEAWGLVGTLEGEWTTITDVLKHYRRWVEAKGYGRSFTVTANNGASFDVDVNQQQREKKLIVPSNARSFGRKLAMFEDHFMAFVTAPYDPSLIAPFLKRKKVNGRRYVCITTVDDCLI